MAVANSSAQSSVLGGRRIWFEVRDARLKGNTVAVTEIIPWGVAGLSGLASLGGKGCEAEKEHGGGHELIGSELRTWPGVQAAELQTSGFFFRSQPAALVQFNAVFENRLKP